MRVQAISEVICMNLYDSVRLIYDLFWLHRQKVERKMNSLRLKQVYD